MGLEKKIRKGKKNIKKIVIKKREKKFEKMKMKRNSYFFKKNHLICFRAMCLCMYRYGFSGIF